MSRWKTQFDEHPIHKALRELHECVVGEITEPEETELAERRRFEKVVATLQTVLSKVDPELVVPDTLNPILNHLNQQVLPQASTYRDSGNVANLSAANDQLSGIFNNLAALQALSGKIEVAPILPELEQQMDQFAAAITKKGMEAEERLKNLGIATEEQRTALSDLGNKIQTQNQELDTRASEWQGQFSEAQDKRSTEFNDWRRAFNDGAQAKIDEITGRVETKLEEAHAKFEAESEEMRTYANSRMDEYLDAAESDQQAIRELHGLAAEDSVVGGYVSNANKEGEAATKWRRGAVFFLVVSATWLFYSFLTRGGQFSWEAALVSIPLTAVLIAAAGYCAQQSTRHRNVEVHNRRFSLEMAAIDPYLQSLPDEDRIALKKELTSRYFGQDLQPDGINKANENMTRRAVETLVQNIKPLADLTKAFK